MVRRIVYINLTLSLLVACSDSTRLSITPNVVSIASLRDVESSYRSVLIDESIVIEGCVVGNDKYGEFYNVLIIEDESAAVRLLCDGDDNYRQYPFGCSVTLHCSGLYLFNSYGSLSIGAEPTSSYTLDYISSERLGQYLKIDEEQSLTYPSPLEISLDELTPLYAYRYLELSEAQIVDTLGVGTFCARDDESGRTVDTSHLIVDKNRDTIALFVDRLCRYADAQLPTKECALQFVVDYFGGEYSAT
ncbi:MAG: DUF5689 domain-containing protein, partial [Rikenellaceae bacterium]